MWQWGTLGFSLLSSHLSMRSNCSEFQSLHYSDTEQPPFRMHAEIPCLYEQFIYYSFCCFVGYDVVSRRLSVVVVVKRVLLRAYTHRYTHKQMHSEAIVPAGCWLHCGTEVFMFLIETRTTKWKLFLFNLIEPETTDGDRRWINGRHVR